MIKKCMSVIFPVVVIVVLVFQQMYILFLSSEIESNAMIQNRNANDNSTTFALIQQLIEYRNNELVRKIEDIEIRMIDKGQILEDN